MILLMQTHSLKGNLFSYLATEETVKSPVASALSRSRRKIKSSAFAYLRDRMIHYFKLFKKWHGYRVLAADGFNLSIPTKAYLELVEEQKENRTILKAQLKTEKPQTHSVHIFDVLNQISLAIEMDVAINTDERRTLLRALEKLEIKGKTLLLGDRGYPAWYFCAILQQYYPNLDFAFKMPYSENDDNGVVCKFLATEKSSEIVTINVTKEKSELAKKLGYEINREIKVRLVRQEMPNEKPMVIATSIMDATITAEDICGLYKERWEIETTHRYLKHNLLIQNWCGLNLEMVRQEVFARQIIYNWAEYFCKTAHEVILVKKPGGKKQIHNGSENVVFALTMVRHFINISKYKKPITNELWQEAIREVRRTRNAVRPNRSFPRNAKYASRDHQPNYKPA